MTVNQEPKSLGNDSERCGEGGHLNKEVFGDASWGIWSDMEREGTTAPLSGSMKNWEKRKVIMTNRPTSAMKKLPSMSEKIKH